MHGIAAAADAAAAVEMHSKEELLATWIYLNSFCHIFVVYLYICILVVTGRHRHSAHKESRYHPEYVTRTGDTMAAPCLLSPECMHKIRRRRITMSDTNNRNKMILDKIAWSAGTRYVCVCVCVWGPSFCSESTTNCLWMRVCILLTIHFFPFGSSLSIVVFRYFNLLFVAN